MKKLGLLVALTTTVVVLNAQTIDEGNKQIYYERYNSAEKTFGQLVKADPANAEAWFGLTKAYILDDKKDEALDKLRSASQAISNSPYYEAALGWALLSNGKADSATLYFNDALDQTRQKNAAILSAVAMAQINVKAGNAAYAVELLQKALKRDKHNPELLVLMGDAYLKMANGSEAYTAYKKAIEENKNYAVAYHRIGEIFLTQKSPEMYLDYFNKAVAADAAYSPSYYQLYRYEFYHNPAKASVYYKDYMANTDVSIKNEYALLDLLYLEKKYDEAISKANNIITSEADKTQPRVYKLIGYGFAASKDTVKAINYMQQYFAKAPDSIVIAKDYATMSELFNSSAGNDSLEKLYLVKATELERDSSALFTYYKKLAELAKNNNDYTEQAKWMERYYTGNKKANNQDLYYWATAHFLAEEYAEADTVFGIYATKYPEQSFGFYWQARCKALLDSNMNDGLAIPAYRTLLEVLQRDTADANYKKWSIEAYAYLASYEANKERDYPEAVEYFEKLLEVDPANEDAKKYIAILEKQIEK